MGARLRRWQKGFELGDVAYKNVLAHKRVLGVSALGAGAEIIRSFSFGSFFDTLLSGGLGECTFCVVAAYLMTVFSYIVGYFVVLGILFYVLRVAHNEPANVLVDFVKSLKRFGYPLFWFVVLIPVGGIFLSFLATSVLPVLAGPRLSLWRSLHKAFSLVKNNFLVILGFFISIGILYFVMILCLRALRFLLQLSHIASLQTLGVVLGGIVEFGVLTFVMAMWCFFLVYLIDVDHTPHK